MHAHTHKKAINYSYKVSTVIPMQVNVTRDPIRMQEQNQELLLVFYYNGFTKPRLCPYDGEEQILVAAR